MNRREEVARSCGRPTVSHRGWIVAVAGALGAAVVTAPTPVRAQDAGVADAGAPVDTGASGDGAAGVPAGLPPVDEVAIRAAIGADTQNTAQGPGGGAVGPGGAATPAAAAVPPMDAQRAVRAPTAGVLNPDTSVIVDGSFGYYGRQKANFDGIGIPASGDDPSPAKEGFTLQEVELAFQAPIDPYLEGAVFLTIPNLEGIEVEEAYLLTTALPGNFQIKAGTFRSQVGRNNTQHLHLQHFTRRPLMTPLLFGADGLRAPGVQLSWLAPGLPWFATFYAEAFSVGAPEDGSVATFGGGGRGPKSLAYTAVLEQFWAPSDATSILLGLNFATGLASECAMPPCGGGRRDYLYGGDLYLKWRPPTVVGERGSVMWATEYFARTLTEGGPTEGALYTEPVVQLARRFHVGGRFDMTGVPAGANLPRRYGAAGSLTFAPSEFSRLRLYGQSLWGADAPRATVAFLQVEVSLGAHGAHPF